MYGTQSVEDRGGCGGGVVHFKVSRDHRRFSARAAAVKYIGVLGFDEIQRDRPLQLTGD